MSSDDQITNAPMLSLLTKSEIDQQIATAKAFPREISVFRKRALQLVTLNEYVAKSCIYALPRREKGGSVKTIEGGSIRFAEILISTYGNSRAGARIVNEGQEFITAQGVFHDLESNVVITREVQRRITTSEGRRYSSDMVIVTGNAVSSIALRNAILSSVPKALWGEIYDAARKVVAGDVKTLVNRRSAAISEFTIFGVTEAMILAALGRNGVQDITIDDLVTLNGMLTAIRDGESNPEELFGEREQKPVRHEPKAKVAEVAAAPAPVVATPEASKPAPAPISEADEEAATLAAFGEPGTMPPPQKPSVSTPPKVPQNGGDKVISAGGLAALRRTIAKHGLQEIDVCHEFKIGAIDLLKISDFDAAMSFVKRKGEAK